jgi:hypothetical protein
VEFVKLNEGEIGEFVVRWIVVCDRMILPPGSFLRREVEEIGYHVLVAFDVLGCKAGVAMHENGGEVTGDL